MTSNTASLGDVRSHEGPELICQVVKSLSFTEQMLYLTRCPAFWCE